MESTGGIFHPSVSRPVATKGTPLDTRLRERYAQVLAEADIRVNGHRPWDMVVVNPQLFRRCLLHGSLGLGEAYVEGWWEAERLDQFFEHLVSARVDEAIVNLPRRFAALLAACCNLQGLRRAHRVAEVHYDLSNELYRAMLGPRMVYTCGYWARANDLDTAQEHKLDLVCRKLELKPGMRVLDIGCGWGSFAKYAAENYGVEVVGVTISQAQVEMARELCRDLPIEIRLQDYREVATQFDRIVSLGMFEHVGRKNYRAYFDTARRNLRPDGLFLLHTIGRNDQGLGVDPWVTRYIFPNSEIPSLARVVQGFDRRFVLEDLHNFGADYARTLCAWHTNFTHAWPTFATPLPAQFQRLWKYYLMLFAGVFRARNLQTWQLVLSPSGVRGGYRRPAY
ncbi:MAG: cyclopropane fatty acyl phospholipid synthase [Gammaproteobacteria bacterium]|nr:cyclopropane fatty acyl phospholipid synthase [Gammaproteobacteria bacterium]